MNYKVAGFTLFALFLGAVIINPLLILFAVNTLFGTGLAYNLANWFSVLVLKGTLYGLFQAARSR